MHGITSLLCLLSFIRFGVAFTPDVTKLVVVSWNKQDSTHSSITHDGIRRAVRTYLQEKNTTATGQSRSLLSKLNPKNWFRKSANDDSDALCWFYSVPYNNVLHEIVVNNSLTDTLPSLKDRADYHFDAEKFNESNTILLASRSEAIRELASGKEHLARNALGTALHTLQDFYSHSNWVEMGNTKPSTGLGTPKGIEVSVAGPKTPTCTPCKQALGECADNLIKTGQLTSGYYRGNLLGGADETVGENGTKVLKPVGAGKCSHGGSFDDASKIDPIGGINKDTSDTKASPHGKWHRQAADMAIQATADFMTALRKEIGNPQFEYLLNLDQVCSNSRRRRSAEMRVQNIELVMANVSVQKFETELSKIHDLLESRHPALIASTNLDTSTDHLYISIDNTLEDIVIEISGVETVSQNTIVLTSPSYVMHLFNITLDAGTVAYIRIQAPEIGRWSMETLEPTSPCGVNVFGVSPWDAIISVLILEQTRHAVGPGLRPLIPDEPVRVGMTIYVRVMTPIEGAGVPKLELHSADGRFMKLVLSAIDTTMADGFTTQLFEVTVPEGPFRFAVQAKDDKDFDVRRFSKTVYRPIVEGDSGKGSTGEGASESNPESKDTMPKIEISRVVPTDQLLAIIIGSAFLLIIVTVLAIISLKAGRNRRNKRKKLSEYEA